MILRTALAAAVIGAAALPLAGIVQAAPLARAEVTKLFPGQFEAQVKGYRVNFTGSRGGSIVGVAYGQQDTGRWYMKAPPSASPSKSGPRARPSAAASASRAAGMSPRVTAATC